MIAVLYDTETSAAISIGSTVPDAVPEGRAVYTLDVPYQALNGYVWDETTCTLAARVVEITTLTAGDFMRRLGLARETYLHAVRMDASAPLATRAQLETLLQWLNRVATTGVDLDDPITATGVTIMAGVLDAGGQLDEGAEAFAAAMLRRAP